MDFSLNKIKGDPKRNMRKKYSKEFKAKVAVEALRGEKTVQEISQLHEVHPNLVNLWKKQLIESAETVFEKQGRDKGLSDAEKKQDELFCQIGQLRVENEFLKKKYKQLFGTEPKL